MRASHKGKKTTLLCLDQPLSPQRLQFALGGREQGDGTKRAPLLTQLNCRMINKGTMDHCYAEIHPVHNP